MRAIHADYKTYEAMQARIKALNERGLGAGPKVSHYYLAKAQCWLDVSFHEYTRNDRSAFPQLALEQADRLLQLMQAGTRPLPDDTPLVNAAAAPGPVWAAAEVLKRHEAFRCAAPRVACAEVEVVHAGNEHAQLGWRHAKPYVQMAEDHLADAEAAAQQCIPPPAARPLPPPPPPPAVPLPVAEAVSYSAAVLFDFGASDAASILPMTRERLDQVMERSRRSGFRLEQVSVSGFTDRLNGSVAPTSTSNCR